MQEIVTLACEKWAAGDKVSVVFSHLQISNIVPLGSSFIQAQIGVVKDKCINIFLSDYITPLIWFLNLTTSLKPQLHFIESKFNSNKNIFLTFSLPMQEIMKNVQTRSQAIYQRNLARDGTPWLEKLSVLKYRIQSMINVME